MKNPAGHQRTTSGLSGLVLFERNLPVFTRTDTNHNTNSYIDEELLVLNPYLEEASKLRNNSKIDHS